MQAYLLGHTLERGAKAGVCWWTVDGGTQRFDTMQAATTWIRKLTQSSVQDLRCCRATSSRASRRHVCTRGTAGTQASTGSVAA